LSERKKPGAGPVAKPKKTFRRSKRANAQLAVVKLDRKVLAEAPRPDPNLVPLE